MNQNRRDFIKSASAFAAASMLPKTTGFGGAICLFSKHLPAMNWARMAQPVNKLGVGGVDLTVRPGGHVPSERARAVAGSLSGRLSATFVSGNYQVGGAFGVRELGTALVIISVSTDIPIRPEHS